MTTRRGAAPRGKRPSIPWYADERVRLRFEGEARRMYPSLRFERRSRRTGGRRRGLHYCGRLLVTGYPARQARLWFPANGGPEDVQVTTDGPQFSPHRNAAPEGAPRPLCLWQPQDPRTRRWTLSNGLVKLLGLVQRHLFMEAYWRDSDEWLGDQAPHGGVPPPSRHARRAARFHH